VASLRDLRHDPQRALRPIAAWTRTAEYQRKLAASLRRIEAWRARCERPYVSVSGGKDSTVMLDLVRRVDPTVPAIMAWAPNLLPGQAAHRERLVVAAGGQWAHVDYPWPFEAVLAGDVTLRSVHPEYPLPLKVSTIRGLARSRGHDGVALGSRAAESRSRRRMLTVKGHTYRDGDGVLRCYPLSDWSAEEVIGHMVAEDVLPMNPVYLQWDSMPRGSLEKLRDGTWWPHGEPNDQRPWLARHYPEVLPLYDAALSRCGWVAM